MSKFDHPNVMRLLGVSISKGKTPFVVMPFMSHGSLLSYLRRNRAQLTVENEDMVELVSLVLTFIDKTFADDFMCSIDREHWLKVALVLSPNCKGNGIPCK